MNPINARLVTLLGATAIASAAQALEPTTVTFDRGTEGWSAGSDCGIVEPHGGLPGAHWNVISQTCDRTTYILQPYFILRNERHPAFIGDYTEKGPVRLSVDVDVTEFTYFRFNLPVEEDRQIVFEFIDYDNPYIDPETGYSWPWTSVIYEAGHLPKRTAGWKHFSVEIADPNSAMLPEGWTGFGGPEDDTGFPQLPPGVTFADVMAGVDELQIHAIEPGYFYDLGFVYDLHFDNITIEPLVYECAGRDATIYVDGDGVVRGGKNDGKVYHGVLVGTAGDDVIVGTSGDDLIQGLAGKDLICGGRGDDQLLGGSGDDMMLGGPGNDVLKGQGGSDYLDGGEDYD